MIARGSSFMLAAVRSWSNSLAIEEDVGATLSQQDAEVQF
jgi:hypothetical protein